MVITNRLQVKASYLGKDITDLPPHKIYRLGLARTFQIPALFWNLTVLENILVGKKDNPGEGFGRLMFEGSWIKEERQAAEEAFKVLQLVGLSHIWDLPASSVSGGQMKLLEIGRALMSGARTIFLDEPISGINPTLAHEIFAKLVKLKDNFRITFFIIEYRLDIALGYVDTLIAMAYGKLIAAGKPDTITADQRVIDAYLGG